MTKSGSAAESSHALDGLLVVAIEQAVAAPMCTLRLADGGARVIKIERESGDTARGYDTAVLGTSAYFAWLNRGKESLVADIKQAGDRELVENLLRRADVFVQNLAPGAAERLGLQSNQIIARYPGIIAVDIAGFGRDTACRDMRAYDMIIQAESGLCAVTGTEETPSKVGVSVADLCTGMNAHAAILEALYERARTGKGRAIEISMFDGLADWMTVPLLHLEHLGKTAGRVGLSHAQIYPYGRFECSDGSLIIAIQSADEWRRFCIGVLEREDLVSDPRFADNPLRVRNRNELDRIIFSLIGQKSVETLIPLLERHKIAWGRYSTIADLARHPALRRFESHVPGGSFQAVTSPLHPDPKPRPVPGLGEHSERIRREFETMAATD